MILNSFMALSMVFVMISMSVESGKRITEVLIEKNLLSNPENPIFSLKDNSIIFENVSFQYSRSEEHTSELQSRQYLVCRLLLEKKKNHGYKVYRQHTSSTCSR